MACPCCVPTTLCCCDSSGPRVVTSPQQCQTATFAAPNPRPTASLVFQWCGLTAQYTLAQGGTPSWYATQNIDEYVCDTTGRYGAGRASYTRATRKYISAIVKPGTVFGGNACGIKGTLTVSVGMEGAGFADFGNNEFLGIETVTVNEIYECQFTQCYDGSQASVTMTLPPGQFTTDDTCGGSGCFTPCKFTAPQFSVILGAP